MATHNLRLAQSSARLVVCCAALVAVLSGCRERSDEYSGEIFEVKIHWEAEPGTNSGAKNVIVLKPGLSVYTPGYGDITLFTARLIQFPEKNFAISGELAKKELIHPHGEETLAIGAPHVQLRCATGSTDVISISFP